MPATSAGDVWLPAMRTRSRMPQRCQSRPLPTLAGRTQALEAKSEVGSSVFGFRGSPGAILDPLGVKISDGWLEEFGPLSPGDLSAVEGVVRCSVHCLDQDGRCVGELIGGNRLTECPLNVGVGGVDLMLDGLKLAVVVVLEAVEHFRWVSDVVEGLGLGFQCVEVFFDWLSFGRDGVDPCLDVRDAALGFGSVAGGLVAVSEAGLSGFGVGFPHGGPQRCPELVFELVDRLLVGPPRSPSRGQGRLHRDEVGCGLGPPAGPGVDQVDEVLAPVFEPGPPRTEPVGDCQPWLRGLLSDKRRDRELLGEFSSLRDRRDVSPVVSDHSFDDVSRFAEVLGVSDDEELVGVSASRHADVQPAMRRRR